MLVEQPQHMVLHMVHMRQMVVLQNEVVIEAVKMMLKRPPHMFNKTCNHSCMLKRASHMLKFKLIFPSHNKLKFSSHIMVATCLEKCVK
jgi:hypothetical protein